MKHYSHEHEITELVRTFENASIGRDAWKHAEHLVVALWYVDRLPFDEAVETMRRGLFKLLVDGFKVDLEKEMPYHETLTVFWMRTVADFNASAKGASLVDKVNEVVQLYDKDYPLRFYSRAFLFSDKARAAYVEPDLPRGAVALG